MSAIIDLRHLSVLGGHEDPELREIIEEFVVELDQHLAVAESIVAAGDDSSPALREVAHKIRGMAGTLGFRPLSALAAEWDQNVAPGPAKHWLDRLRSEIAQAIAAWNELKATS